MYVVDLVAPGVVNTMPEGTLRAVADHGVRRRRHDPAALRPDAQQVLDGLAAVGIDYDDVVRRPGGRGRSRSSKRPGPGDGPPHRAADRRRRRRRVHPYGRT